MENILIFIFLVFVAATTWFIYCNGNTYTQRMKLISVTFHDPSGDWSKEAIKYLHMFDKVSYGEHAIALMLFRSPFDLYDQRLIERLRNDP